MNKLLLTTLITLMASTAFGVDETKQPKKQRVINIHFKVPPEHFSNRRPCMNFGTDFNGKPTEQSLTDQQKRLENMTRIMAEQMLYNSDGTPRNPW